MSAPESARTLAEDVLARAAEDWVSAAEVIDLVRRSGVADASSLRDLAVGLIARLIIDGFLVPGDIEEHRHVPWDTSTDAAVARIVARWSAVEEPFVMPGDIVWLDTTASGQVVGESVWRREAD